MRKLIIIIINILVIVYSTLRFYLISPSYDLYIYIYIYIYIYKNTLSTIYSISIFSIF